MEFNKRYYKVILIIDEVPEGFEVVRYLSNGERVIKSNEPKDGYMNLEQITQYIKDNHVEELD